MNAPVNTTATPAVTALTGALTGNANSWPYESSRVIAGLARVLHNAGYASAVAAAETKAVSVETCKSSCCSFVVGCSRPDTH